MAAEAAAGAVTRKVGTLNITPIINGLWQNSRPTVSTDRMVQAMRKYSAAGFNTWDGADHYGPSEKLMGLHSAGTSAGGPGGGIYLTKWVPNAGPMTRATVEPAIRKSMKLMRTDALDMLQFHWWDYSDTRYIDAMKVLQELQAEGLVKNLALTNFDTAHMKQIVDAGVTLASNQVAYSIIDTRPENAMVDFCLNNDIKLLTYGTLLGGWLSSRYLGKDPPRYQNELDTPSKGKFFKWIMAWGGWDLYQELLGTLKKIGDKHGVGLEQVAIRYILDKPAVGGVIVGARLGVSDHIEDNRKALGLALDDDDRQLIAGVVAKGRPLRGEPGDEYRGVDI